MSELTYEQYLQKRENIVNNLRDNYDQLRMLEKHKPTMQISLSLASWLQPEEKPGESNAYDVLSTIVPELIDSAIKINKKSFYENAQLLKDLDNQYIDYFNQLFNNNPPNNEDLSNNANNLWNINIDELGDLQQKINDLNQEIAEINNQLQNLQDIADKLANTTDPEEFKKLCDQLEKLNKTLKDKYEKDKEEYEGAKSIAPNQVIDPIMLDLDNDGIETTDIIEGIYFDHDQDGFAEATAWVGEDDGLLVMDRNGNGTIDDGSELFGNYTPLSDGSTANDGYEALTDLDSNSDGVIDANDEEFSSLQVLKGDGTLLKLEEAGIQSISLDYTETDITDENENQQVATGTYTKTDGTTGEVGEYNLDTNSSDTVQTEWLEEPLDIQNLPNIRGFGNVYTLHQAMVRDESGELKALVEAFAAETDPDVRAALVEQIIFVWAGVEDVNPSSRGSYIDARILEALEEFMGEEFYSEVNGSANPIEEAADTLKDLYNNKYEYIYAQLMSQTHFKSLSNLIEYDYNEETGELTYNLDAVIAELQNQLALDQAEGTEILRQYLRMLEGLGIDDYTDMEYFYDSFDNIIGDFIDPLAAANKILIEGTYGNDNGTDSISGTLEDEAILGKDGNDYIHARMGEDYVEGGDGNDTILTCYGDDIAYGGEGNDSIFAGNWENTDKDTIIGGTGDDFLDGSHGADTYIYALGDGNDTIFDRGNHDDDSYMDKLILEGIALSQVTFSASTADLDSSRFPETILTIYIEETGESIQIYQEGFGDSTWSEYASQIEAFVFDDTTIYISEVLSSLQTLGTEGDDSLRGSRFGETIMGYEGDDTIIANVNDEELSYGSDTVDGGEGNDVIYTSKASDSILGGAGDDTINAGSGSDTILAGAGNDFISGE